MIAVAMAAIATGAVLAVRLCRATRIRRTAGSLAFTLAEVGMVVNVFDTREQPRALHVGALDPAVGLALIARSGGASSGARGGAARALKYDAQRRVAG